MPLPGSGRGAGTPAGAGGWGVGDVQPLRDPPWPTAALPWPRRATPEPRRCTAEARAPSPLASNSPCRLSKPSGRWPDPSGRASNSSARPSGSSGRPSGSSGRTSEPMGRARGISLHQRRASPQSVFVKCRPARGPAGPRSSPVGPANSPIGPGFRPGGAQGCRHGWSESSRQTRGKVRRASPPRQGRRRESGATGRRWAASPPPLRGGPVNFTRSAGSARKAALPPSTACATPKAASLHQWRQPGAPPGRGSGTSGSRGAWCTRFTPDPGPGRACSRPARACSRLRSAPRRLQDPSPKARGCRWSGLGSRAGARP